LSELIELKPSIPYNPRSFLLQSAPIFPIFEMRMAVRDGRTLIEVFDFGLLNASLRHSRIRLINEYGFQSAPAKQRRISSRRGRQLAAGKFVQYQLQQQWRRAKETRTRYVGLDMYVSAEKRHLIPRIGDDRGGLSKWQ
jgi:hypothetical protein